MKLYELNLANNHLVEVDIADTDANALRNLIKLNLSSNDIEFESSQIVIDFV